MKMNPASRLKLKLVQLTTNWDPSDDTTVEIGVDDDWYPAHWVGEAPVKNLGAKWTWSAESDDWFAGPEVDDETSIPLELGVHKVEARLTTGDQVVAFRTADLTVAE